MKRSLIFTGLLCLIALALYAANPTFQSFVASQFATSVPGNTVAIKTGATVTNVVDYGTFQLPGIPGGGGFFAALDASGNVTAEIPAGGGGVATNLPGGINYTFYVRTNGNDHTGAIGASNAPFLTLNGALTNLLATPRTTQDRFIVDVGNGRFSGMASNLTLSVSNTLFRGIMPQLDSRSNLVNGSVIIGTNLFDADGIQFDGFGFACTNSDGLVICYNASLNVPERAKVGVTARNLWLFDPVTNSTTHGLLTENNTNGYFENIHSYGGAYNVVDKGVGNTWIGLDLANAGVGNFIAKSDTNTGPCFGGKVFGIYAQNSPCPVLFTTAGSYVLTNYQVLGLLTNNTGPVTYTGNVDLTGSVSYNGGFNPIGQFIVNTYEQNSMFLNGQNGQANMIWQINGSSIGGVAANGSGFSVYSGGGQPLALTANGANLNLSATGGGLLTQIANRVILNSSITDPDYIVYYATTNQPQLNFGNNMFSGGIGYNGYLTNNSFGAPPGRMFISTESTNGVANIFFTVQGTGVAEFSNTVVNFYAPVNMTSTLGVSGLITANGGFSTVGTVATTVLIVSNNATFLGTNFTFGPTVMTNKPLLELMDAITTNTINTNGFIVTDHGTNQIVAQGAQVNVQNLNVTNNLLVGGAITGNGSGLTNLPAIGSLNGSGTNTTLAGTLTNTSTSIHYTNGSGFQQYLAYPLNVTLQQAYYFGNSIGSWLFQQSPAQWSLQDSNGNAFFTLNQAPGAGIGFIGGNGSGLTNLNASQLSSGTVPLAQMNGVVLTNNETQSSAFPLAGGTTTFAVATNVLVVTNGNVGIGTTGPSALLTVQGTSGNLIQAFNVGTSEFSVSSGGVVTIPAASTYGFVGGGIAYGQNGFSYGTGFAIGPASTASTMNLVMGYGQAQTGDLGLINIHVASSISAGTITMLDIAPNFSSQTGTAGYTALKVNPTAGGGSGANNIADFQSSGTSRMVIMSSGNVGIGTATPNYQLDVNGTASVSNLFTAQFGVSNMRSNLMAPTTFTCPATTVNWTNPLNCDINVFMDNSGVTGTAIKYNGSQIYSSLIGDVLIPLGVGEYFSATYTIGTPTTKYSPTR